jgi:nucleoside-diphosphate-sugar epimerase
MAILITGGTGSVGSPLTRHLVLEQGRDDVVLFDLYPDPTRIGEVAERVRIVRGDVRDPLALVDTLRRHDVDRIVHLAFIMGSGNPDDGKALPFVHTLCVGTANVFEAARVAGIPRVAFASSAAVFGGPGDHGKPASVPAVEDDPKRPRHVYAASKLWAEQLADWYNDRHGMEILSLRICRSFGYGNPGSLAAGLSTRRGGSFFEAPELIAAGRPVRVPADDEVADFLYAADTAQAFALAATAARPRHSVFNLRGEQRPVGDWTRQLRALYPEAQIDVVPGSGLPLQIMDNARIVDELAFRPRYTLETGLEAYAEEVARMGARAIGVAA